MKSSFLNLRKLLLLGLMLSLSLSVTVSTVFADGHANDDCVIPESGPWPPCATGGNTGNAGNTNDGCVIPESGPWPPCATGGNTGNAGNTNDGCVIPESGPWPPCATGGNTGNAGNTGESADTGDAADTGESADADESEERVYEIIDFITLVYNSNPSEVLGTFPVIIFDAELMTVSMIFNWVNLSEMSDSLNAAASGDQAACDRFEDAYEAIRDTAIFFAEVPSEWQGLNVLYVDTFIESLDRTRPAYLSCFDAGRIDDFNRDLARLSITETMPRLEAGINAAIAMLEAAQ